MCYKSIRADLIRDYLIARISLLANGICDRWWCCRDGGVLWRLVKFDLQHVILGWQRSKNIWLVYPLTCRKTRKTSSRLMKTQSQLDNKGHNLGAGKAIEEAPGQKEKWLRWVEFFISEEGSNVDALPHWKASVRTPRESKSVLRMLYG